MTSYAKLLIFHDMDHFFVTFTKILIVLGGFIPCKKIKKFCLKKQQNTK